MPGETQGPGPAGRRGPPRRTIAMSAVRAAATVTLLLAVYYLLPLDGTLGLPSGIVLTGALGAFIALGVWQVRSILHAEYPAVRATEVLSVLIPLFVVAFASYYYLLESRASGSFSDSLSRSDALYFTVTTLTTVGFGDIVARSQPARIAVTVQMVADLAVLGALVRTAVRAVTHGWERQHPAAHAASPAAGDVAPAQPAEHR